MTPKEPNTAQPPLAGPQPWTTAPMPHSGELPDVQGAEDVRGIHLQRAGVSGLRYPVTVVGQDGEAHPTVADFAFSVDVPPSDKGTHMSRFIEVLAASDRRIGVRDMQELAATVRERAEAATARVRASFPLFLPRSAPVSGSTALSEYEARLVADATADDCALTIGVRVPVTSLCPCSKAISDYGAHNQRGLLTLDVRTTSDAAGVAHVIDLEELVEIAEAAGSCPVFPLLKRSDERWVTMRAYDHPVFVEDMVRDVAVKLQADERVAWFRIHAENLESIHAHNAFAATEWTRE